MLDFGEPEGRRLLGRLRRRWEDMDLGEVGWWDVNWVRSIWRAVVNTVMNLAVP
jgi:hypothetical protein